MGLLHKDDLSEVRDERNLRPHHIYDGGVLSHSSCYCTSKPDPECDKDGIELSDSFTMVWSTSIHKRM
jgi:hypothetical protein